VKYQRKRKCQVCGFNKNKTIFKQNFAKILDVSILDGYDVVICTNCGFCFANNIPVQVFFDTYYTKNSKYEYGDRGGKESNYDLKRFQLDSKIIAQFIPSSQAKILDIGCSTGRLLYILKQHGYNETLGLDPSPACAKAAQKLYGINVVTNTLSDFTIDKSKFDFLILIGVIEHIERLSEVLQKMRHLLSKGGLIYIQVPDATRFYRWVDAPFQQFSTEHINFFSLISLTNLMNRYGFSRVYYQLELREQNKGIMMPVISAIFRRDDIINDFAFSCDFDIENNLFKYIELSRKLERKIFQVIDDIISDDKEIIVWGVGTHTLRLLAVSKLANAKIIAFVDSNPKYRKKKLINIPIITPEELKSKNRNEPIFISTRIYQKQIKQQIKDLKINNESILIY
jgi:SAM-dependent methyltransferase